MLIAKITDTHFGGKSDSKIFMNYIKKFYDNVFFPYLEKYNIQTIVHLGDIVDRRKFINYVTLHDFKRIFVNRCVENGRELIGIVGNHDIPYRNTNEVNAMNELFNHSNVTFFDSPTEYDFDGCKIALLPWINNTNYAESMEFVKNTSAHILFGHLDLAGFEMHMGMKSYDGMQPELFSKFDMVCSGHFHHKSSSGNIHYLGCPYEMFWNDYNEQRGFHIFDTETRELTFIQNPYRLFYKLWYDDTDKNFEEYTNHFNYNDYQDTYVKVIVQNKTNPYLFDVILDNLYKANPANISIVEDNKNMDQQSEEEIISEAEDTLTSLYKYVDNMKTNVDKNRLNQLFADLYTEAQNVEL